MIADDLTPITIEATVNASVEKVWEHWTNPEHIKIGPLHLQNGMHQKLKMIYGKAGNFVQPWRRMMGA